MMSNNFSGKELWLTFRNILFPEKCLGCSAVLNGNQGVSFCQACLQDVRFIQEPFCTRCGKPFEKSAGKSHLCSYCLKNKWYFTRARSAVYYQEPIAGAVKTFKYSGKMYGLETFAALACQYYKKQPLPKPDIILPVPLHSVRLRRRGFNQALVLARKLFPAYKRLIDPHVLERHRETCVQAGLNMAERRRNVKNAFRVRRPEKVIKKRILLVDDVFTTGATVNECARILLKCRAANVEVFTFALAPDRK